MPCDVVHRVGQVVLSSVVQHYISSIRVTLQLLSASGQGLLKFTALKLYAILSAYYGAY